MTSISQTFKCRSLLDLKGISFEDVQKVFYTARSFQNKENFTSLAGKTAALLFFEPSTRTRTSFEVACAEQGLYPIRLDGGGGTSIEKGETIKHTILNIAAMNPVVIVLRSGGSVPLYEIAQQIQQPIINAGWGLSGHPTQALLDVFSLVESGVEIKGHKLLIVGDVAHSRVAASHFELMEVLGYKLAVCGPEEFLNGSGIPNAGVQKFQSLDEGLQWADSVMCLRVQTERHTQGYDLHHFHRDFGMDRLRLEKASQSKKIKLLHPGPVNLGVEISHDVYDHPQSLILRQVASGVLIRKALIRLFSEGF